MGWKYTLLLDASEIISLFQLHMAILKLVLMEEGAGVRSSGISKGQGTQSRILHQEPGERESSFALQKIKKSFESRLVTTFCFSISPTIDCSD